MRGHALVDGGLDRPAAFARVGDAPGKFAQHGILYQRRGREIEQPGRDHAAAPPDLYNVGEVKVVFVVLGIAQRRRFCIDCAGLRADIGGFEHPEPFGICRHHSVFDSVVDHFDEMAGTMGSAMQIALLGRAVDPFAARCARNIAAARRKRNEDRIEVLHDFDVAADHHAITALKPPDAAARADVDIMNALGCQVLGPANIVDVIGIAAVNENVAALEMGQQLGDNIIHYAGRHHQPDGARLGEFLDEVREQRGADGLLLHQLRHCVCRSVAYDALMAAPQEATHHIPAHPAKADHSELHGFSPP